MFEILELGFLRGKFAQNVVIPLLVMIPCSVHPNEYTVDPQKIGEQYEETGRHDTLQRQ